MVMVGNEQLATARIVTFLSVIPMIVFVNVLNDWFSRFTVVAIVNTCFAVSFSCVNVLLRTDQFGLGPPERPPSPDRFVGWINYLLIEAYGSVAIATFWAMVNVSTKSASSAKRCYPLLVISGQVAGVLGPFVSRYSSVFGLVNLRSHKHARRTPATSRPTMPRSVDQSTAMTPLPTPPPYSTRSQSTKRPPPAS